MSILKTFEFINALLCASFPLLWADSITDASKIPSKAKIHSFVIATYSVRGHALVIRKAIDLTRPFPYQRPRLARVLFVWGPPDLMASLHKTRLRMESFKLHQTRVNRLIWVIIGYSE